MQYEHITLYVSNLEVSLVFYRDLLGLHVLRRISPGNRKIAFLGEAGQPGIELIEAGGEVPVKSGFSLGFRVESLDDAARMLKNAGYPLLHGPVSPNDAVRFSFFSDPDGIKIQLLEYHDHSLSNDI